MSSYKLAMIDPRFVAETIARTGSDQLLTKAMRMFVGLYDEEKGWYIPLHGRLGNNKPSGSYMETPFSTDNPHFSHPGLDFQKALYVPSNRIIEIENTLPKEQYQFILDHQEEIRDKFQSYILSLETIEKSSKQYLISTVPLFPEGIEKIKELAQETEQEKAQLGPSPLQEKRPETYEEMKQRHQKELNKHLYFASDEESLEKLMIEEFHLDPKNEKYKVFSIGETGYYPQTDGEVIDSIRQRQSKEKHEALHQDKNGLGYIKEMYLYELQELDKESPGFIPDFYATPEWLGVEESNEQTAIYQKGYDEALKELRAEKARKGPELDLTQDEKRATIELDNRLAPHLSPTGSPFNEPRAKNFLTRFRDGKLSAVQETLKNNPELLDRFLARIEAWNPPKTPKSKHSPHR